jgi:hypothetical protein
MEIFHEFKMLETSTLDIFKIKGSISIIFNVYTHDLRFFVAQQTKLCQKCYKLFQQALNEPCPTQTNAALCSLYRCSRITKKKKTLI